MYFRCIATDQINYYYYYDDEESQEFVVFVGLHSAAPINVREDLKYVVLCL